MKYLKSYNESVRDFMKPKLDDDIKNSIKNLSPIEKLDNGATHGLVWLVQQAIDDGVKVFFQAGQALGTACALGHYDVVKLLLEHQANVHFCDEYCLFLAGRYGHTDIIKLLLSYGADINKMDSDYKKLFISHYEDKYDELLGLSKNYTPTNESVNHESSINNDLVLACREGRIDLVRSSIKQGADINYNFGTPLKNAAEWGNLDIVKLLLHKGAEMSWADSYIEKIGGDVAKYLFNHKKRGPFKMVKDYIKHKFTNESVRDMMKPVSKEKIDEFINKYYSLNIALLKAVQMGDTDLVKIVIERGADVHEDNEEVLRYAADKEDDDMVKTLIRLGADPEWAIKYHKLTKPGKYSHVIDTIRFHSDSSESVRGMMKPKSEEEIMNSVKTIEPKRRMEIAATQGMTNVLKDAVKNGADFRHNADFILRVACYNGQLDIVKFLVDKGADVNAVKGQPLYQAFARGYVDVARYLLEHGADIKVIMNFRQMERPVNAETKRQLRELRTEFSEKANEV